MDVAVFYKVDSVVRYDRAYLVTIKTINDDIFLFLLRVS